MDLDETQNGPERVSPSLSHSFTLKLPVIMNIYIRIYGIGAWPSGYNVFFPTMGPGLVFKVINLTAR